MLKKFNFILIVLSFAIFVGCDKVNHIHLESDWIIEKEATCSEKGLKYRKCAECGERIAEEEFESDHYVNQWKLIEAPTDNADGLEKGQCEVCDMDISRPIKLFECNGTSGIIYELNEDGLSYSAVDYEGEEVKIIIGRYYNNLSVTGLENGTFANYKNVTSVVIPEGIKRIGDSSFLNCNNLSNVEISEGVTSIGESAFYGCVNLSIITLPESLVSIESRAFYNCYRMKKIEIPKNVSEIGTFLFEGCSNLENIIVHADNVNYKSIDGNVYSKDEKTFVQYACGKKETIFMIPNGVINIAASSFAASYNLTEVAIPDTVTKIEPLSFSYCTKLKKIIIPKTVSYVGFSAFKNCYEVTFYCEAESFPLNWSYDWNWHNRPVVWGHKE